MTWQSPAVTDLRPPLQAHHRASRKTVFRKGISQLPSTPPFPAFPLPALHGVAGFWFAITATNTGRVGDAQGLFET